MESSSCLCSSSELMSNQMMEPSLERLVARALSLAPNSVPIKHKKTRICFQILHQIESRILRSLGAPKREAESKQNTRVLTSWSTRARPFLAPNHEKNSVLIRVKTEFVFESCTLEPWSAEGVNSRKNRTVESCRALGAPISASVESRTEQTSSVELLERRSTSAENSTNESKNLPNASHLSNS